MHNTERFFTTTSLVAWALVFLMVFAGPTRSADQQETTNAESEDTPSPTLEEVLITEDVWQIPDGGTIATKLPMPLQSTPASVSLVPRSLFSEQKAEILGDALQNVSGVNVQTNLGVHDYFVTRGFGSLTNGLVLTDGVLEPEATFYHLYNVERVEMLKGPGAFLYGGNPLSGTVNLVRKQPRFENFSRFNGSYGSFQSYRGNLDVNLAHAEQDIAGRLNALWQTSDNYRDDKDSEVRAIHPALNWRLTSRTTLELDFEYVDNEYKADAGLPLLDSSIPDVSRTLSYQSPFDISEQQIYRARADIEADISDSVTLRNKLYYTDLDWPSKGTLLNGAGPVPEAPDNILVFRSLLLLDDHQRLFGDQLEAVFSFETGPVAHQLLTGIEFSRLTDEFTLDVAELPPVDLFAPSTAQDTEDRLIPGQSTAGDARSIVLAPYLVDQIRVTDEVQFLLGGRFDTIDYEDELTETSRDYEKLSPMVGAVYSPTDAFSFYANAGQAFAPPSSQVVGDREAEESMQVEIGGKQQLLGGKLRTSLAFYYLKKENIAIPDDNGVTQQTGDQRSAGMELELWAQPMRGLHTFLAYAFTDAELTEFREALLVPTATGDLRPQVFDRSGNTPAFAPRHILNFWISPQFKRGLGLGFGGRYVSSQFIAEDNAFAIDGVLTFDATVHYTLGRWKGRVHFENLTDREYAKRGFGANSVIPADPLTVYAMVELMVD